MIEIKPPHSYAAHMHMKSVFLGGSIEMGKAIDWQTQIAKALASSDILILNPRRDNWDSSWKQSIDTPQFREQVEWELDALDAADFVVFYFDPNTKSPITLMELGLHAAGNPEKVIVCCPEGFWRKGNVDIVCRRYGVAQVDTVVALADAVLSRLKKVA